MSVFDIYSRMKKAVIDALAINRITNEFKELLMEEMFSNDKCSLRTSKLTEADGKIMFTRVYLPGTFGKIDEDKANRFYLESLQLGDEDSEIGLGMLYLQGGETERASTCFQRLANRGNCKGQVCLGYVLLQDRSNPNNIHYACDLFIKAANKGSGIAQYILGELYENGSPFGMKENAYIALTWFKKSSSSGYRHANLRVSQLNEKGHS